MMVLLHANLLYKYVSIPHDTTRYGYTTIACCNVAVAI